MRVRSPVVPAKAGTSHPCPCVDVGAVREPPEGHAIPNVSPTQRQLPIAPSPPSPYIGCMRHSRADPPRRSREGGVGPFSRWEKVRMRVRSPVVPAKAGTSHPCPCVDVGAVREPPEGHAIPNVSPTRRQLPIAPSLPQPLHWLHTSFTRLSPVVPAKAGRNPLSLWERARVRVRTTGNATKCNQMQLN